MRWLTRHRTAVTAAGAAVLVALVGAAVVLAVQTRANAALKAANADLAVANTEVTRANADLAAANQRERARFALAMEAIRTFHSGVSEDVLLKQEEFKALRTKLLRGAREFYRKLEGLLQGHEDRDSRLALGRAYLEVSELTRQLDSVEEANAVLGARPGSLLGAVPGEPGRRGVSTRWHSARERSESSSTWLGSRMRDSRRSCGRGSSSAALAAAHPGDRQLQRDWAESERHVAASLDIRDRPTEAIEAIERARSILATPNKEGPPSNAEEAEPPGNIRNPGHDPG